MVFRQKFFRPTKRRIVLSKASGGSGITGTSAPTEGADSQVASGAIAVSGTSAPVEAADSQTATGSVIVSGTSAPTEGVDTQSAAGTITTIGTSAPTEGADTQSASGVLASSGTSAPTEGADTQSASGGTGINGTATPTGGDDTVSSSGVVAVIGTAAPTEGADSQSASGTTVPPAVGSGAPTEGADTQSSFGLIPIVGSANTVELADNVTAIGQITVEASGLVRITPNGFRLMCFDAFNTYWADRTPIAWQNVDFDPTDGTAQTAGFVRVTVQHNTGTQAELAGKRFRRNGQLIIQVFTPRGAGMMQQSSIVSDCMAFVENVPALNYSNPVWRNPVVNEIGPDGDYYQQNISVDFEYDTHSTGDIPAQYA